MSIWGALISVVGGGVMNSEGGKAGEKGNKAAQAQIEAAKAETAKNFGPYAAVGDQSLNRLAALSGIEGYRTKSDIALREHLATKPQLNYAGNQKKDSLEKWYLASPSNKILADGGAGGIGGAGRLNSKRRKRQAINDQNMQIAVANQATETAAWEAKKVELEKQRDIELQSYDPGKAQGDYLRNSPGYKFRFDENIRGLDASGSSKGDLLSGAQRIRISERSQDLASQEYGNEFSRLLQLAGIGQNAATAKSNVAVGAGSNLASLSVAGGNQQAQRYDNYNDILQGGVRDYSYLSRRDKNRSSSFDPDEGPNSTPPKDDF